ncbi:MAG: hypothetical protein JNM63_02945, partial [Spirochaetia bacterium]|nr:hypothetical protein [Spirochaetia bacterium]
MLFIDTFWRAPFLALAWVISATGMLETLAGADNTALKIMEDETVVFSSDLDEGKAKLLFPPKKIIKVQRADGSQEYEEGKDFILEQGRVLQLTPGSQIPLMPYFTNAALKGVYNVSDTSQKFIFSPGSSLKHKKYDIRVTYSHAEGDLDRLYAGSTESKLSKTIAKLKQG